MVQFWHGIEVSHTSGAILEGPVTPSFQIVMYIDDSERARAISIVPPGTQHIGLKDAPGAVLVAKLSPSLLRTAAEASGLDMNELQFEVRHHLNDVRIEHVMWALKAELDINDSHDAPYVKSLGLALASRLVRHYSKQRATSANELSRRRVVRVTRYIEEHLGEQLLLSTLSQVAGLSVTHLKRQFKFFTGRTLHQYIMNARVEFAIQELLTARVPLADLAERAGFADQSHMARWMKRIAGVTPGSIATERLVASYK